MGNSLIEHVSIDTIEGIRLTELKTFEGQSGSVMRALRQTEDDFRSFGEAYFSTVNCGAFKGWRKHREMTMNLLVPAGEIQFFIFDDREGSPTFQKTGSINLSQTNYQRLHVSPGLWVAFRGCAENLNLLLNVADIMHDPEEAENRPLDDHRMPQLK